MKTVKLFRGSLFGIYLLFGLIAVSTSALCIYTVNKQLSREYAVNSVAISHAIAHASEAVLQTRDVSSLQALLDQNHEIQGISYLYVTDEHGDFIAHTFVPEVPAEIFAEHGKRLDAVERNLNGIGEVIEVGSPILEGLAGSVHVGMDESMVALKIRSAVGKQVYLISILFILSIAVSFWLMNRAAAPLHRLADYARQVAGLQPKALTEEEVAALLGRNDEAGELARLYRHLANSQSGVQR
jgi:hypothetical protein